MEFAPPGAVERRAAPLVFTGTGREYFGIWIVNLVLSIVTLGIYSAWAKVRRLQYFYRNTSLAGASFDYHGRPVAILKGRIIALVLLVAYNFAGYVDPRLALIVFGVLAVMLPWLLLRSLRFKLHNSSHRGLRFSFRGSLGESYVVFLLLPLATAASLYLLGPLWHQQLKRYQHNHAWYGGTTFGFDAPIGSFYRIWLTAAGMILGGILIVALLTAMAVPHLIETPPAAWPAYLVIAGIVIAAAALLFILFVRPYVTARIQNLVWNNTVLGPHRFASRMSARRLFYIALTNLIGVALTLGLYRPFAVVRLLKYRVESIALVAGGDPGDFVTDRDQDIGAAGEEAAEMFDFDIAL